MHPSVHQELVRLRHDEIERQAARAVAHIPRRPSTAARSRARLRPLAFRLLRIPATPAPRAGTC